MSEIMDRYIDRMMLIEELQRLKQDFIDAEVDSKVMAGLLSALRHIKSFPAADVKKGPQWIPVAPETMPPEDEKGVSDNLVLKVVTDDRTLIFVGFTRYEEWYSAMLGDGDVLSDDCKVTHWMYAKDLAEVQ